MKKLNSAVDRVVRNKHRFMEAEVTESTLKKINIDKLLADIAETEKLLTTNCTFDNVQLLTAQYQQVFSLNSSDILQVVEYYSALGDTRFDIYLKKMKDLMMREDTQACMHEDKPNS